MQRQLRDAPTRRPASHLLQRALHTTDQHEALDGDVGMKRIILRHQVQQALGPTLQDELPLELLTITQHHHDAQQHHAFRLPRRLVDAAHQRLHEALLHHHLPTLRYDG